MFNGCDLIWIVFFGCSVQVIVRVLVVNQCLLWLFLDYRWVWCEISLQKCVLLLLVVSYCLMFLCSRLWVMVVFQFVILICGKLVNIMCVVFGLKVMLNLVVGVMLLWQVIVLFIIRKCFMCCGKVGLSFSVSVMLVSGFSVIRNSLLVYWCDRCRIVSVVCLVLVVWVVGGRLMLLKLLVLCMWVVFIEGCSSGLV